MKIQHNPNLELNSKKTPLDSPQKSQVEFKGMETGLIQAMNFLNTNQAWGATAVDLGCMVVPRTAVDFTRGPDAGFETMRRESSGTANHAMVGAYGLIAAWALSRGLNSEFNVKMHKMFINNTTADFMTEIWNQNLHLPKEERAKKLVYEVLSNVHAFNPDKAAEGTRGYVPLASDEKALKEAADKILENTLTNKDKKTLDASKKYVKSIIANATGSENTFKITKQLSEKTKDTFALDTMIDDIYSLTKSFLSSNVEKAFQESKENLGSNRFIRGLKRFNEKVAMLGMGIAVLVGVSVQPINMYLTRKKTGKSGFVGVEGREPDKSKGFFALKTAVALAFGLSILRSIGKPSEILSRIQFKGFTPTINQFKLVYGITIMSRFLSARDKNELRESSIKDSLGFLNWLILGSFVSKLAASGIEKLTGNKLTRYNAQENGKGIKWLINSKLTTVEEILHETLKSKGLSSIENNQAMSIKQMLKKAPEAKTRIRYLNFVQFLGYLYSGLVLGMGIPKLNIAITKSIEEKRKAKQQAQKSQQTQQVQKA